MRAATVALALGLALCAGPVWAQEAGATPPELVTVAAFPVTSADGEGVPVEMADKVWRAALERVREEESGVTFVVVTADSATVQRALAEGALREADLVPQPDVEQARTIASALGAGVALTPRAQWGDEQKTEMGVVVTVVGALGQGTELAAFELAAMAPTTDQTWLESNAEALARRLEERVCPVARQMVEGAKEEAAGAAQEAYEQARQALEAGDLQQAEALAREALRGKRVPAEYHLLLADIYRRQGKIEAAAGEYKAAARMAPDSIEARRRYADCLAQLGQVGEAIAEFEAVVKGAPDDRESLVALARLYLREERAKEAAVLLKKALDLNPGDAELALQLAAAYERINRGQEALGIYQQLIGEGKAGPDLLERMAELQAEREHFLAAFDYYVEAGKRWTGTMYLDAKGTERLARVLDNVAVAALEGAREALIGFSRGELMREEAFAALYRGRARLGQGVGLLDKVRVPPGYAELMGKWRQAASLAYQALTDQVLFVDLNDARYNTTASSLFEQAGREVLGAREILRQLTRSSPLG